MFLNSPRMIKELLQGRRVRMTIHQMIKEISINHDYEISQINIVLKGSVVWMKRYEIFLIAGKGASGNLHHSRSLDDY